MLWELSVCGLLLLYPYTRIVDGFWFVVLFEGDAC